MIKSDFFKLINSFILLLFLISLSFSITTSDNSPFGWQTSPFNISLSVNTSNTTSLNYTSYRINFGSWINSSTIPILTTGTYFISYYSVDNLSNVEPLNNITANLDITKPITIDNLSSIWHSNIFNITLNSTDVGSGVSSTFYKIGLGNWTNSNIIPIVLEGNNTVSYYSSDIAGNVENFNIIYPLLDLGSPNTTNNAPTTWQNSIYNIILTSNENGSGTNYTNYKINLGNWTNSSTIPINFEGNNTISYYSVDNVGNIEPTKTIYSLLDLTNPNTTNNAPTTWQNSSFNINLAVFENGSGINFTSYKLDGGSWINSTTISITTGANHTILYYSKDNSGNLEPTKIIYSALDLVKPTTTDNSPIGWQTSIFSVSLSPIDSLSGILNTSYRLNLGSWINSTTISITSSGIYNLEYYSTDKAKNSEVVVSKNLFLDINKPITTDNSPTGWQTSIFNISLNPTDIHSGISYTSYRINSGSWINSTNIVINTSGIFNIDYYSVDLSGNIEIVNSIVSKLDLKKPITTDNSAIGWQTSAFNLIFSVNETISGVNFTTYKINSGNWTNGSSVLISNEKNNTIIYYSVDNAQNIEPLNTIFVAIDSIKPNTTNDAPTTWQNAPYLISLTSFENNSGILNTSYRINGGSWINSSTISISSSANNTIEYYSTDIAGNLEPIKTIYSLLDLVKPTTTDNAPVGFSNSSFNITLSPIDSLSGILNTYYRINNGSFSTGTNIEINTSGIYSIDYYSVDNIGNIEVSNQVNVSLDFTPVQIISKNILSPVSYSLNKTYNFSLNLFEDTGISNATLIFNGSRYLMNNISNSYFYSFSNLSLGVYNYSFEIYNLAGNLLNISNSIFEILNLSNNSLIVNNSNYTIPINITNIIIPNGLSNSIINTSLNISNTKLINLNFSNMLNNGSVNLTNSLNLIRLFNSSSNSLFLKANTSLVSNSSWDGSFLMPTISTNNYSVSSGVVNLVLDIGSKNFKINLSKPAKITLFNMSGKKAGWSSLNSTSLIPISIVCDSLTNPTNINLTNRECYINSGSDLVIWTLHFTSFGAYTSNPTTVTNTTSGSSGSGSTTTTSTTTTSPIITSTPIFTTTTNLSTINSSTTSNLVVKNLKWPAIEFGLINHSNNLSFNYLGTSNSIKLERIYFSSKQIDISIFKTKSKYILNESENILVDSNGNGVLDLKLWFKFNSNNKPKIYMQGLFVSVSEDVLSSVSNNSKLVSSNISKTKILDMNEILKLSDINAQINSRKNISSKNLTSNSKSISLFGYVLIILALAILGYIGIGYFRWKNYVEIEEEKEYEKNNKINSNNLNQNSKSMTDYVSQRKEDNLNKKSTD